MSSNSSRPGRVPQFPSTPDHFARFFADYLQAVPDELSRQGCERVFLLVSTSLDRKTDRIAKLEQALAGKIVGKKVGVKAHTPYTDVLDLAEQLHKSRADSIVSVGGSSYTDGAKTAMIVHSSLKPSELSISTMQSLAGGRGDDSRATTHRDVQEPILELFVVPTTLSAAEYNPGAGASNPDTHKKEPFIHPRCRPRCVILDPELCTITPPRVWLGSGMRAVDHCVEGLCSDHSVGAAAEAAEEGLRQLVPGLLACRADKSDIDAHGMCQVGAWKAMEIVPRKIPMGASHGIGHQLGSVAGVAHGETSCILLPSVLKYNKSVNSALQEKVASILWDVAGGTFEGQSLSREKADAGDLVRAFVRTLGLPATLAEVGVEDEERLDLIAKHTLTDICTKTNPRPLTSKEQVREILRMAA